MLTSFLNIKKAFFSMYRGAFFVRFVVNNFLTFISISASLISEIFLYLQIVRKSFSNICASVSANSFHNLKALENQGLFLFYPFVTV